MLDAGSQTPTLLSPQTIRIARKSQDLLHFLESRGHPRLAQASVGIFTRRTDPDIDALGLALLQRSVPYVRVDIDDLMEGAGVAVSWDVSTSRVELALKEHTYQPSLIFFHLFDLALYPAAACPREAAASHHRRESWAGLVRSLMTDDATTVVNSPAATSGLTRLNQLRLARRCGLNTPPTIVTSNPGEVGGALGRDVVVKPLGEHFIELVEGDESLCFETQPRRVRVRDLAGLGALTTTPVIVQPFLEHDFEARVYIVKGQSPIALRIEDLNGFEEAHTHIDPAAISVSITSIPEKVARSLGHFMDLAGVDYAAIDLLPGEGGNEWAFLEANFSGGWRCYERFMDEDLITGMVTDYVMHKLAKH